MKTTMRAVFALASIFANTAFAQNLFPNYNFDNDQQIAGWTGDPADAISFDTYDFNFSNSSGSLLIQSENFLTATGTSPCFTVSPQTAYSFGGRYIATDGEIDGSVNVTFSCTGYSTNTCTGTSTSLGETAPSPTTAPLFPPIVNATDSSTHSAQCTISVQAGPTSFFGGAYVELDDLYFNSVAPVASGVTLGGYLTGSWYDPMQSGQGFQLEFTNQADTVIATWFTFEPGVTGKPVWIYSQGTYNPTQSSVTLNAAVEHGASFPPAFKPSDVVQVPWGTLTFSFSDCNHATVNWASTVPGYGSGSEQLVRMTSIAGTSCPQ